MVHHQRGWSPNDMRFYIVVGWKLFDKLVDPDTVSDADLGSCELVLFPFGQGKIVTFSWEEMSKYIGIAVVHT